MQNQEPSEMHSPAGDGQAEDARDSSAPTGAGPTSRNQPPVPPAGVVRPESNGGPGQGGTGDGQGLSREGGQRGRSDRQYGQNTPFSDTTPPETSTRWLWFIGGFLFALIGVVLALVFNWRRSAAVRFDALRYAVLGMIVGLIVEMLILMVLQQTGSMDAFFTLLGEPPQTGSVF